MVCTQKLGLLWVNIIPIFNFVGLEKTVTKMAVCLKTMKICHICIRWLKSISSQLWKIWDSVYTFQKDKHTVTKTDSQKMFQSLYTMISAILKPERGCSTGPWNRLQTCLSTSFRVHAAPKIWSKYATQIQTSWTRSCPYPPTLRADLGTKKVLFSYGNLVTYKDRCRGVSN